MSDEESSEGRGLGPLAVTALIAIAVPMLFSISNSSSRTVNGVVVAASYFDPIAVVGGAVGLIAALLHGVKGRGAARSRWILAAIVLVVGARHVVHGLGLDLGVARSGTTDVADAPTGNDATCDEDTPAACPALCDKGDGDACDELGTAYALGEGGLEVDLTKAETLFLKACELKDRQGCSNLASLFYSGKASFDGAKALEFAKQGCAMKSFKACDQAGGLLADGKGVEGDFAAALTLFAQSCEGGYAEGCFDQARLTRDGQGRDADAEAALKLFEKGCTLNHGPSCNDQAVLLDDDDRSAEDRALAVKLFLKACQHDSVFGCSNYGHRVKDTDAAAALDPLDKGCTGGRTRACEDLGLLLFLGAEGVEKNLPQARRVFARGCEAGHGNSCVNHGIMLIDGIGGAVDLDEGVESLQQACTLKETKGCARLGLALAATDPVAAKPLLTDACKANFNDACVALKKLGKGAPKKKGKK